MNKINKFVQGHISYCDVQFLGSIKNEICHSPYIQHDKVSAIDRRTLEQF